MTDPGDRYSPYIERLVASVLGPSGHAGAELRRAALGSSSGDVPPWLGGYVDKVASDAYRISDEDVAALQGAGGADDAIFEITIAAAVGAALGRLERGLAALRGEEG